MNYRKELKELVPYKPGKSTQEIKEQYKLDKIIKICSNENPYGTAKEVQEVIKKNNNLVQIYPDNYCTELRQILSKKYKISKEKLIFGNGSNEIIQMIARALLNKDDEVITCVPGFELYKSSTIIQSGKFIPVLLKNYTFDLDGMLNKINKKTKIIYIANPNNPTGTIITGKQQEDFLKKVPKEVMVVIDEAYFEYVTSKEYPNSIELIDKYSNLCILRTFSKAYGLAGIRIGYGMANKEFINELEKVRNPFNVSVLAQESAKAVLKSNFMNESVRKNKQVLEYLYKELDKIKIEYIKTQANFIMLDMKMDSQIAFEKFIEQGFIVRSGFEILDTFIRITVGTMEEMKLFITALKKIIKN